MTTCATCGRGTATAAVESSHPTSEGTVRYRRCACGTRWMELTHAVLAARTRPVQ
ncbi:hypothetical protein ACFFX1_37025 [Dactylosporangium sucinum]|uniref:hypothetical protein n=1 Tax=Dactylosporangium sucinum TaxID=1424081 RepID=UPI0035EAC640